MGRLSENERRAARLLSLRVQDFLLIEDAGLEPAAGFNALTGETGTGKSILLQALGLVLGRRGAPEWIRRGADTLTVEAHFSAPPAALRAAREAGVPATGATLLLTRQLRRRGGSRCHVNGRRVLVRTLVRLGALLVETHGQREAERFRRSEVQRDLLDLFGGLAAERRAVRDAHRAERAAAAALARHAADLERLARDEEWVRFQLTEIDRLKPEPGEEEALREHVAALKRAAARAEFVRLAEDLLQGREGSLLEILETLDHRAGLLPSQEGWDAWREQLRELLAGARALHRELRGRARGGAEEAEALPAAEERLGELERLQRKHRRPLVEICALAEELRASLALLAEGESREAQLRAAWTQCRDALGQAAARLTEGRVAAAAALGRALARELGAIEMRQCRLRVVVAADAGLEIGPAGAGRIVFEVETNPGEGFRPLGEIASGGEMARIALALRVVLGARGSPQAAVFDEIDAGLGGGAARAVAERLQQVARHRQVLLVTHLPLIAAAAARQFRVTKGNHAGRARVQITAVRGEERVAEIARMLSGEPRDEEALRHARALLARGNRLPEQGGSANTEQ